MSRNLRPVPVDQSISRIQDWLDSRKLQFSIFQILGLSLVLVTAFVLRSETEFTFQNALVFFAFAFVSTVPLGGIIVELLLPDLKSRSVRAALIGITGYATSVTVGFLLGSSRNPMGIPSALCDRAFRMARVAVRESSDTRNNPA